MNFKEKEINDKKTLSKKNINYVNKTHPNGCEYLTKEEIRDLNKAEKLIKDMISNIWLDSDSGDFKKDLKDIKNKLSKMKKLQKEL